MTRDQIIALAREAGINVTDGNTFADDMYISVLYRFASLVAAAEREACAKMCDDRIGTRAMARHCADLIRARGKE